MTDSNKPRLRVHRHSVTVYSAGMSIKKVQLLDGFLERKDTCFRNKWGIQFIFRNANFSVEQLRKIIPDECHAEFERAAKPLERLTRRIFERLVGPSYAIEDAVRTMVSDACVAVDNLEIAIRSLLGADKGFVTDAELWFELGLEVPDMSCYFHPPDAFGLPLLAKFQSTGGEELTWCWNDGAKVSELLTELRLEANGLFKDPESLEDLELPIASGDQSDDFFLVHLWGCLTGGWRYLEKHASNELTPSEVDHLVSKQEDKKSDVAEVVNDVEIDYGDNCYALQTSRNQPLPIPPNYSKLFSSFVEKVLTGSPGEPVDWLKLNEAVKTDSDDPVSVVTNKASVGLRAAKSNLARLFQRLGKTPDGEDWIGTIKGTGYFLNTSVNWTLSKKLDPHSVKSSATVKARTIEENTPGHDSRLPSRPITRKPTHGSTDDD